MADRRCKCDILARRYGDVLQIEFDRLGLPVKEAFPGRHIGVEPARQERRRHIEHQNVGVMISANSLSVFIAHGLRPSRDQFPEVRFVAGLRAIHYVCHSLPLSHFKSETQAYAIGLEGETRSAVQTMMAPDQAR